MLVTTQQCSSQGHHINSEPIKFKHHRSDAGDLDDQADAQLMQEESHRRARRRPAVAAHTVTMATEKVDAVEQACTSREDSAAASIVRMGRRNHHSNITIASEASPRRIETHGGRADMTPARS